MKVLHPHAFRILSCVLVVIDIISTKAFTSLATRWHQRSSCITDHRKSPGCLQVHNLQTAWEWLAEQRMEEGGYQGVSWIDPAADDKATTLECQNDEELSLPLYPLPAVYLPCKEVNHTLNNVEPKNLKMALDLMNNTKSEDRRLCVVLRALDTGRIASVGTIMRVLDIDKQCWPDGSISRIVVTCQAEGLADIVSIENGQVESRRNKLMKSPEYLRARVCRSITTYSNTGNNNLQETIQQLVLDYDFVKSMYVDGVGQTEIPGFARQDLLSSMPDWSEDDFATEESFWKAASSWQTLCYTVREARQISLSADRNELMVAEASKKGGPLKLPIHTSDLPPDAQRKLQSLEVERQQEFALSCRMDPVLDFAALIQLKCLSERIHLLAQMVSRERQRLTELALGGPGTNGQDSRFEEEPRKGAWFDDFQ